MNRNRTAPFLVLLTAAALALPGGEAQAQEREQTFVLQPGWNSIYLEVQPDPVEPDAVFQGVPVASVWTWNAEESRVEFIQNPAEGLVSRPGWLGFFPRNRPEAFLTNLFGILANRPYLIKLEGTQPFTWTVSGRPRVRETRWVTDSFNLVGFHVDPAAPPTFEDFFAPSVSHTGQPIYRLSGAGAWELVADPFSTAVPSGEAFWIYTAGASEYQGPLEIVLEDGDSLEYGASLVARQLLFRNSTTADTTVILRRQDSEVPFTVTVRDPVSDQRSFPDLPSALPVEVPAGGETAVELSVKRADLAIDVAESLFEITDTLGTRRFLAARAKSAFSPPDFELESTASATAGAAATRGRARRAPTFDRAGLWVGNVAVNAVSEARLGGVTPLPTGAAFEFRVILHVDSGGRVRLLKEVIELVEEGTLMPDPDDPNRLTVDEPLRYVLITDDDLIPNFTGAGLRDGVPVGLRLSTAAYDFPEQFLEMGGAFQFGGRLTATIVLESEFPTNPFRHKFHPDHDNKDAQFLNFLEEAYVVTRDIELELTDTDPNGVNEQPDWGESRMAGIYRETISGVHRNDIKVAGIFRLERVSGVTTLNE